MTRKKQKVIVIVGPTSSGKSDVAVELARQFDGEVISADSRQVYSRLDIGTGKITKREMKGVPHHLLDVASPRRTYSAGEYARDARRAIEDVVRRGKVPIVAGGTGFFIDAALGDVALPDVPPDPALRAKLEARGATALFKTLQKLDPRRAKTVDRHNRRRLIRAIEIAKNKRKKKSPYYSKDYGPYDVLKIGIRIPEDTLKKRIRTRLIKRLKQGLVAEVKRLHERGLSWKRMEELGLEYRFVSRYLRGLLTKEEMVEALERAISRYAKRQKRWFSYDTTTKWFTPSKIAGFSPSAKKKMVKIVRIFLQG